MGVKKMQRYTLKELKPLVMEYHDSQRDKIIKIVRSVFDGSGCQGVLVRVGGRCKMPYSVIDDVCRDGYGRVYVTEVMSCPTVEEDGMILYYTRRGAQNDEDPDVGPDDEEIMQEERDRWV